MTAKKTHYTALGKPFDMGAFREQNANLPAITQGGVKMNARGDILDANKNILVKRENIDQEYNRRKNINNVRDANLPELEADIITPQQITTTVVPDQPENIVVKKRRIIEEE